MYNSPRGILHGSIGDYTRVPCVLITGGSGLYAESWGQLLQ